MRHRRVPTTGEVYSAIVRHHTECTGLRALVVYATGSGYPGEEGVSLTEWGLRESPCPIVGAETRPRPNGESATEYWLCVPIKEEES